MNEPIFLKPFFQDRIWGGTKLKTLFGYDIPSEQTGECWAVSAHPGGQSLAKGGVHEGVALSDLWNNHPELFSAKSKVFPLLTKILDASDDLSVQVHPDDAFAGEHEHGELGKTECWYIIDAEPGAEIIYGHTANSREELRQQIENGSWDQLLTRIPVKTGDFFYVPSGTIHALGKGIVVLETQQSSDTTYRVYDYDRKDSMGNTRELHLEKAIEVTTIPQSYQAVQYETALHDKTEITSFVSNEFFTVQKWHVYGNSSFDSIETYRIFSVLDGEGELTVDGQVHPLRKGDHFLLPAGFGPYELSGNLQFIVSWT